MLELIFKKLQGSLLKTANVHFLRRSALAAITASAFAFSACQKEITASEIPAITYKVLTPLEYTYDRTPTPGQPSDTTYMYFDFVDGDGDLGAKDDNDRTLYVQLFDQRPTDTVEINYTLPFITPPGDRKAIRGEIRLALTGIIVPPGLTSQKATYRLRIRDRAGNWSNEIKTPALTVYAVN